MADFRAGPNTAIVPLEIISGAEYRTLKARFSLYYRLTKPGIVYANVMTALAGYLFGSKWHIELTKMAAVLLGTALIIASACVVNNYTDRGIDSKMKRTRNRATVTGKIPTNRVIVFALVLGAIGFAILAFTNLLTIAIGATAFFSYTVLYGIAKRRSKYGTLVGTLPGAAALVAGYAAASGKLDLAALLVFMVMVSWQMAHFFSIATYRLKDYKQAGLPVWPAAVGIDSTKRQIVFYIIAFLLACEALFIYNYGGYIFALVMTAIGGCWLYLALRGFKLADSTLWARKLFFFSLVVLLSFSVMLPFGRILP